MATQDSPSFDPHLHQPCEATPNQFTSQESPALNQNASASSNISEGATFTDDMSQEPEPAVYKRGVVVHRRGGSGIANHRLYKPASIAAFSAAGSIKFSGRNKGNSRQLLKSNISLDIKQMPNDLLSPPTPGKSPTSTYSSRRRIEQSKYETCIGWIKSIGKFVYDSKRLLGVEWTMVKSEMLKYHKTYWMHVIQCDTCSSPQCSKQFRFQQIRHNPQEIFLVYEVGRHIDSLNHRIINERGPDWRNCLIEPLFLLLLPENEPISSAPKGCRGMLPYPANPYVGITYDSSTKCWVTYWKILNSDGSWDLDTFSYSIDEQDGSEYKAQLLALRRCEKIQKQLQNQNRGVSSRESSLSSADKPPLEINEPNGNSIGPSISTFNSANETIITKLEPNNFVPAAKSSPRRYILSSKIPTNTKPTDLNDANYSFPDTNGNLSVISSEISNIPSNDTENNMESTALYTENEVNPFQVHRGTRNRKTKSSSILSQVDDQNKHVA